MDDDLEVDCSQHYQVEETVSRLASDTEDLQSNHTVQDILKEVQEDDLRAAQP